jgi:TonB-linked SusC/RagA family outer membrane protein
MKIIFLRELSFMVLLCLFVLPVMAQTKALSGKVTDQKTGTPLIAVTIAAKGTSTGTNTDANGDFKLNVPDNATTLVISYIGYKPQEITIGATTTFDIKLEGDATTLKEVAVVGIGYGTQSVREVTSSVAHLSTDDFRQSGSRNALDLIQGKVAGLTLSRTSGTNPNSGVSVQLRGVVTFSGSTAPLYVIDGIPGGNLDLLQQDDIESIDVLKDGSGAAIYGTSANAGVIIITTKKGKPGTPKYDYSSYVRKEYIQNRLKFLTADQFRARIASGDILQKDFGSSTDFVDQLINHGNLTQNHNLALSGGSDKSSYRASINYRDLEGIAKQNGRKEYSLRLSMNQTGLDNRLKMQLDLATNFNNANLLGGGGWESEQTKNPTLSNFNPDGSFRFDLTSNNEYARLFQETNYRKQQTTSVDGKADLTIIPGLVASVFGSVVRDNYADGAYRLKASENSLENTTFPGGGYASRGGTLNQDYALEPTITYKTTIAKHHDITAVAGYSYRYSIGESFSEANLGFINDLYHEDNLGAGTALTLGKASEASNKADNTLVALFGRVNYDFDNKYLAQVIVRREGSSRFGDNNKFGLFPSASLGWILSEEDFIKKIPGINYLKLRVGYGVTGNSGFGNLTSLVTLGTGGVYIYPDGSFNQTYGPNKNPNPNLKWETKRELNIGADFTLLHNKLTGSIDLYKRTTKDLLDTYTSPQPPFIQSTISANVGTISSKGIELLLGYTPISRKNFKWHIDGTVSRNKNVLDSYSNDQYKVLYKTFGGIGGAGALGNAITTYEGEDLGVFWGKRFAGFTPDGKWLFYKRDGSKVTNDQINNSLDKNVTDLAPIGNAIPKWFASLGQDFNYKNFDLRVYFRGAFDYNILNTTALSYANKTWSGNLLQSTFDKYKDIKDTYQYSDYYIEKGTFVKLDEVTLGYNLKIKTKFIRNCRVYVSGQNLATFTGYTGTDPDYIPINGTGPGIDNRSAYPSTRSFLLGLNVGF